jgi:hypothetical protein
MIQEISSALNQLVKDASVPDIDTLVKSESHFDRTSLAQTKRYVEEHGDLFATWSQDNKIEEDHYNVFIQKLNLVSKLIDDSIGDKCGWGIHTVYGISFITAPCLILKISRIGTLVSSQPKSSDDPAPNGANRLRRLNVPVETFLGRLGKEIVRRDKLWGQFCNNELMMVTTSFKQVNSKFYATPLTRDYIPYNFSFYLSDPTS